METDSFETEMNQAMIAATKMAHIRKKPKTGNASSIPSFESNLPFLYGNLDAEVDQLRYEKYFREKPFCPVVSVNFQALKNDTELNLDLSGMLGHYECWLKVDEEFSPEVVRKFYCNMTMTTKDDDAEVVRTRLRGREIELTREKLNEFLGAPQVSAEPLQPMSAAEAQQILLQSDLELMVEKRFQPSRMCDFYRIIHYVFSRSLINKSYSFTYLSREDCVLLARIIRGDKLDVGGWIFEQLKTFSTSKWQTEVFMPFPQIVSLILKKFNINHLQGESKRKIETFDKSQLRKMKIQLPFDHKKGMLPPSAKDKGKKKVGTPEPESEDIPKVAPRDSQPPPQSSAPFTGGSQGSLAQ